VASPWPRLQDLSKQCAALRTAGRDASADREAIVADRSQSLLAAKDQGNMRLVETGSATNRLFGTMPNFRTIKMPTRFRARRFRSAVLSPALTRPVTAILLARGSLGIGKQVGNCLLG
jgi:hypothetical protein